MNLVPSSIRSKFKHLGGIGEVKKEKIHHSIMIVKKGDQY